MPSLLTIYFTENEVQSFNNDNKALHNLKPSYISSFVSYYSPLCSLWHSPISWLLYLMFPLPVTKDGLMVCIQCSSTKPHIQKRAPMLGFNALQSHF